MACTHALSSWKLTLSRKEVLCSDRNSSILQHNQHWFYCNTFLNSQSRSSFSSAATFSWCLCTRYSSTTDPFACSWCCLHIGFHLTSQTSIPSPGFFRLSYYIKIQELSWRSCTNCKLGIKYHMSYLKKYLEYTHRVNIHLWSCEFMYSPVGWTYRPPSLFCVGLRSLGALRWKRDSAGFFLDVNKKVSTKKVLITPLMRQNKNMNIGNK